MPNQGVTQSFEVGLVQLMLTSAWAVIKPQLGGAFSMFAFAAGVVFAFTMIYKLMGWQAPRFAAAANPETADYAAYRVKLHARNVGRGWKNMWED